MVCQIDTPSGKHTQNYGKSHFLIGKSTISMAIHNSYVKLPEGKVWENPQVKLLNFQTTCFSGRWKWRVIGFDIVQNHIWRYRF